MTLSLLIAALLSQASPTVIVDPTVQSKRAPVTNSAPASNAYGLNVRVVSQPAGGAAVTATQGPAADGGTAWSTLSQVWDGTDKAGVSAGGSLQVTCDNCGGSTFEDNDAFTPGTSTVSNAGLEVDDTATTAVTENSAGAQRMTTFRAAHTVLRDSAGNERGANVTAGNALVVDGSASTQPISAAALPLPTGAATAANQTTVGNQTTKINDGTDTALVSAGGALLVDGSATTQPISGTVTIGTFPDNEPFNVAQINGVTPLMGVGASGTGALRTASLLHDGTDTALVTTGGSLQIDEVSIAGTAISTGVGASGTGTRRVASLLHDGTDTALITTAGSLQADLFSLAGNGVSTGVGASGTGTLRTAALLHDGTTTVGVIAGTTALKTDLSSVAGTATATGNGTAAGSIRVSVASDSTGTIIATQATAANLNVRPDTSGATGAAPPARANFIGGLGSGATGGFVIGIPVADSHAVVNISSATTTLIVTGVSGRHVRIAAINLVTAAANNVALISGTGATCGTGTAGIAGGTTAASGWNFAANGGLTLGNGLGEALRTVAAGDSVCIVTSAATQLSGHLSYTIY